MTGIDPHTAAAAALRSAIARAVEGLVTDLEKAGRAQLRLPAMRVEGRGQLAQAKAIREQAKRTGWLL